MAGEPNLGVTDHDLQHEQAEIRLLDLNIRTAKRLAHHSAERVDLLGLNQHRRGRALSSHLELLNKQLLAALFEFGDAALKRVVERNDAFLDGRVKARKPILRRA
ncbi:MAG: hypothetical protein ACREFL_22405 [Stellaceae bacterium]